MPISMLAVSWITGAGQYIFNYVINFDKAGKQLGRTDVFIKTVKNIYEAPRNDIV